jgi:predicted SnoaL-like aldol condensation-catalyzing enzyme
VPDLGAFVRGYLDRVVNRRDLTAVDDLVSQEYTGGGYGWPATRDDLRRFYEEQARTRPAWRVDVRETVEVGDCVAVRALAGDESRRVDWLAYYRVADVTIREITVLALVPRD